VIRSEKKPGNPGFFILGLLPSATVFHPVFAQNWNVFWKAKNRLAGSEFGRPSSFHQVTLDPAF
jgi:hypothetical protein